MENQEYDYKNNEEVENAKVKTSVQQMRPDDSQESVNIPPTNQEVQAAVEEMNPDENSMNSRGKKKS